MSHAGMMYEDVVLGRYYIDNWVMGMVLLHDGILIDSTEASSEWSLLHCSTWNPSGRQHLLEKGTLGVDKLQRLFLQQENNEERLSMEFSTSRKLLDL